MIKPYIIYNEYGDPMIRHPRLPTLIGMPNARYIERSEVNGIVDAVFSVVDACSPINADVNLVTTPIEDLKYEVVKLINKQWDKMKLPSIRTIKD